MNPVRTSILSALAVLSLFSFASLARADDTPLPTKHPVAERCRADPQKCREAREKWRAWCKQNPERCEQLKQQRKEMREQCKKDPQTCAEKRKEMREKIEQLRQEKADATNTTGTPQGN